jgi:hypothetical protein
MLCYTVLCYGMTADVMVQFAMLWYDRGCYSLRCYGVTEDVTVYCVMG